MDIINTVVTNLSLMEFRVRYSARFCLFSVIDAFEWIWMGSLHKNSQLPLEFLKSMFLILHRINDPPDDTLLYCRCNQGFDLLQPGMAAELESDLRDTVEWGRKWLADFKASKTQLVSFDRSSNTSAIDGKMGGSVREEKYLLRFWDCLSLLNWIGAPAFSLLLKLPWLLCCHVWLVLQATTWRCQINHKNRYVSLEPLVHSGIVTSLRIFYRYYFGRYSFEQAQQVPLP